MPLLTILFTSSLYFAACVGMGSFLLVALKWGRKEFTSSAAIQIATRFLLGQGLLGNFWIFIALPGYFSPFLVKSIITILAVLGISLNHQLFREFWQKVIGLIQESINETWGWKIIIIGTLLIWLSWLPFWFPLWASGTRFYMALPKVISASEQLKVLPGYEEVASIGLQGEMQFAALMSMGSPESIQFFSWLTFTAGCIFLLALGGFLGLNRRSQWIVLVMVFTSSAVTLLSGSGKTDLFAPAFAFASIYWIFNINNENRYQVSTLIGLFSGMAVMAKLNYAGNFLPTLAILLIWKIFYQPNKITFKTHFLPFLIIGFFFLTIAIQMPIKNQILFDEPLAPYGMKNISSQVWYGTETITRVYLTLPLTLTFGNYWAQIGNISPLFLMYLPLLLLLDRPIQIFKSPLIVTSIASLVGLSIWFYINPSNFAPRYFLANLILLFLPIAKAVSRYSSLGKSNFYLTQSTVILIISYTFLNYTTFIDLKNIDYQVLFDGKINCKNDPIWCKINNAVNTDLEPGKRVFTNSRFRYWFRPDLIQCSATTSELQNYPDIPTPEMRWKFLIGRGFSAIVLENRDAEIPNTIRADLNEIPEWVTITVIENSKEFIYLRLHPKPSSQLSLYTCGQITPPAWDIIEITNSN